jgi:signal transduction histidine kinase
MMGWRQSLGAAHRLEVKDDERFKGMSTAHRTRGQAPVTPRIGHVVFPLGRLRSRERLAVAQALADERRRMAAAVHDLIMQDLSYALASARTLADDPATAPRANIVVAAGERALAGAREVVDALVSHDRKPIAEAIETVVGVAARGVPLSFDAQVAPASPQPDPLTFDTLLHIGREAVTNAVKHADPLAVEVLLTHDEEWHLRVRDDGRGFDTANTDGGFGLRSMRSHAQALGGSLHVTSAVGATGTMVEAILP